MEPKVISQCVEGSRRRGEGWAYLPSQLVTEQSGSANNWALGYSSHGPASAAAVCERARREVERCDYFGGFSIIQSVAGGTGSGVGTHLTELLRDEFSAPHCLNTVVLPYDAGEVIVQNYNALLTMSHLAQVSDGILLLENEQLDRVCTQMLKIESPSLDDLNGVIAQSIAAPLLPHSAVSRAPLADVLSHLCKNPAFPVLSAKIAPLMPPRSIEFSSFTWKGLLNLLHQMHITDSAVETDVDWQISVDGSRSGSGSSNGCNGVDPTVNRSVANLAVLCGSGADSADMSQFTNPALYTTWADDSPLLTHRSLQRFGDCEKTAALLSNSQSALGPLERVCSRAHDMFASKAYVHQYEAHGIGVAEFQNAFVQLEQVICDYRSL
jgi:tubulin delta